MRHKKSIFKFLYYVIMIFLSIFMILPLFWMITTSLKESGALTAIPIEWIPKRLVLDHTQNCLPYFPLARRLSIA